MEFNTKGRCWGQFAEWINRMRAEHVRLCDILLGENVMTF